MNREGAEQALDIAKRHYSSNNLDSAIRFTKKSIALNPTPEASAFLTKLQAAQANGSTPSATTSARETPQASTSTAAGRAAGKAPERKASSTTTAASDEKKREFTPQQAALVKRVRACKVTQYYEILSLEKGCSDGDVKKAYRKLALGLHPDKCGAPGAEEAFKMVSKAFQVLSDSNKRAIFDQTGGDPDSRGGGGGGAGMHPFARGGNGGGSGGEELSPEDLFRFFFQGGGGGGGPFGQGGGFQFYGPGGVRMQTGGFGAQPGARRRAAGQGQAQPQNSIWMQIAPLLILFAFSLITQLPNLFGLGSPPNPDFSFEHSTKYSLERTTANMGINYFVNPPQFAQHPIFASFLKLNPQLGFTSKHEPNTAAHRTDLVNFLRHQPQLTETAGKPMKLNIPKDLHRFEKTVEESWVSYLQQVCRAEIADRSERLERAKGFFGFGADWDKVREITAESLPRCAALSDLGYRVVY